MSEPAQIDITARRRVPFVEHYVFLDENFTGSAFRMQVRQFKDTTGTALIDHTLGGGLALLYAGAATVSAHITAGRLTSEIYTMINPATGALYQSADSVTLSVFGIGILASFLTALPFPSERGDAFVGWYDIIRTPSGGGDNDPIQEGMFTVLAGVTIP